MGEGCQEVCCICCFLISFVAYFIAIGVGWAFSQQLYPGNHLILGGAVLTTIPVLAVFGYLWALGTFGKDSTVTAMAGCCAVFTVSIGGLLELIGAILFIAAGVQLKDESSQALSYGVAAGVFGLIAGITCCCSVGCCCAATQQNDGRETNKDDMPE